MANGTVLLGTLLQYLPNTIADDNTGERLVGTGQALGDGHEVRLDGVVMAAEIGTDTAKTGNHFIDNQQHIVLGQYRLDRLPVAFRRRHDTAGSQHRLGNESRDGLGAFGQDQLFQFPSTILGELTLAHALLLGGAVIVVGCLGVQDARQRQVELVVERLEPGQRAGRQTRAVVATLARDHFLLLRASQHIVVVAHDLELGFVGIRATQAIEDLGHAGAGQFDDFL